MDWVVGAWSSGMWALADAAPPGTDLSIFAQYGVLGVFVIILVVYARTSVKREIERADRLEAEPLEH